MRLVIVIVNYRTAEFVQDCLHSLVGQLQVDNDRVVVVDNNSGDNSVGQLLATIKDNDWS